jgi:thiol:disulfide interchange protein
MRFYFLIFRVLGTTVRFSAKSCRVAVAAALLICGGISVLYAEPITREHLTVELVAQHTALVPGTRAWVGVRLDHEAHWHTYWTNPGDSGLPTKLAWRLPDGFIADAIAWPAPARMIVGDLHNFGFDGEMLLPVSVQVPSTVRPGERVRLEVDVNWLVCKEECIPGRATLLLDLPVIDQAAADHEASDTRWQTLFAHALATEPVVADWQAVAAARGNEIEIRIDGTDLPDTDHLDAFVVQPQLLGNASLRIARRTDAILIQAQRSEYFVRAPQQFDLVLVAHSGDTVNAWTTKVTWREDAVPSASNDANAVADSAQAANTTATGSIGSGSLGAALLLAFFGGVLLNLMPCVFPVLSLKALNIADSAHAPAVARREGLAYLAGCVVGFVALASVLLALRGAGQSLGWGFQLQSPLVVAALAYLMIGLGLSLSGVYVFGARLGGVGQSLTEGHGLRSAFFTGLLACVVASPCTAPFMGPALGFALTQPVFGALAVFVALGIGLALPIVILGWIPALGRRLPKPGAWMERLKQVLAWPMYLTAVWLLWVLMRQVGADPTALVLVGIVAFIAALVWYGRWQPYDAQWPQRLAIALLFLISLAPMLPLASPYANSAAHADAAEQTLWQPWSVTRLAEARASGQSVFVNMTAAWCITCLANERVALSSNDFIAKLGTDNVLYLKGDWTTQDSEISAYLAEFGRSGVPLYLVYPRNGGAPEVLPQILTPGLVIAALSRATTGSITPVDSRSSP